ncbi:MAG: response regulator [Polyangia bacterium]
MKPRVLIVDDSITVRMDLRAVLSMAGFDVTSCPSCESALAVLKVQPFDLAILDVLLPDGSGIDVLKEIKQTPELRSIRVFMLSTEAEVRSRLLGLRLGADLYVGKPYDRGYVARMAREQFKMADYSGPADSRRSLSNRKILLVDDSPTFREALALVLRQGGNQVVLAACGEDALALAAVERFDAIFVDLIMPGLDGIETCRRLRALRSTALAPIALMTSSIEAHKAAEATAAGADELLLKPANLGQIIERLRALLLKKQRGLAQISAEPGTRADELPSAARGSLLYRQVIAASGLSELMARSVIDRALQRSGSTPETLVPEQLQRALAYIGDVLRIFLPPDESSRRIAELTALAALATPADAAEPPRRERPFLYKASS